MASFLQNALLGAGQGWAAAEVNDADARLKQEEERAKQLRLEHLEEIKGQQALILQEQKDKEANKRNDADNETLKHNAELRYGNSGLLGGSKSGKTEKVPLRVKLFNEQLTEYEKLVQKYTEEAANATVIDGKKTTEYLDNLRTAIRNKKRYMAHIAPDLWEAYNGKDDVLDTSATVPIEDYVRGYELAKDEGEGADYIKQLPVSVRAKVVAAIQDKNRKAEQQQRTVHLRNTRKKASDDRFMRERIANLERDLNRPGVPPQAQSAIKREIDSLRQKLEVLPEDWAINDPRDGLLQHNEWRP